MGLWRSWMGLGSGMFNEDHGQEPEQEEFGGKSEV